MERVPCEPDPKCKFYKRDGCYQNLHHLFFPRRNYTTPIEKQFRADPRNILRMCRAEHERLHYREPPPDKPPIQEMQVFVRNKDMTMENIRDRGNPEYRAQQIQDVVGFLGQVSTNRVMPQKMHLERTGLAQDEFDAHAGFDSEGMYHDPKLRYE